MFDFFYFDVCALFNRFWNPKEMYLEDPQSGVIDLTIDNEIAADVNETSQEYEVSDIFQFFIS